MKLTRFRMVTFLALSLLVLAAVVAFGSWYAPLLGDAGIRLQHYLFQPLFALGGQPITFLFIVKAAIFLVVLTSRFSFHDAGAAEASSYPCTSCRWAAICRRQSDLVFSVCARPDRWIAIFGAEFKQPCSGGRRARNRSRIGPAGNRQQFCHYAACGIVATPLERC
jgi:hypothetical protein